MAGKLTQDDGKRPGLLGQIAGFGVVGVLAFIIDYGLMILLTEVFSVNYLISTTISFIVSVIFNYSMSMRYVFAHKKGMSRQREFIIFVVLSVIGLGINDLLMWLGTDLVGIQYWITKIFATGVVMVWNFITRKKFLDGSGEAAEGADAGEAAGSSVEESCEAESSAAGR